MRHTESESLVTLENRYQKENKKPMRITLLC